MKENKNNKFLGRIKTKRNRIFLKKFFGWCFACFIIIFCLIKIISIVGDREVSEKELVQKTEKEEIEINEDYVIYERIKIEEQKQHEKKINVEQKQVEKEDDCKKNLGEFELTAYCSCEKCCGIWATKRPIDENGNQIVYGSSGAILEAGISVSVDPSVISYGSEIEMNGKRYIAHDCGGSIKGNRIDVYFENHQDALEFGVQYADVFLIGCKE